MAAEENVSMNFQYGTESLNYYFKQGKLSQQDHTTIQEAMKNLYNAINNSVKNYNHLYNAARIIKKDQTHAKTDLQAATTRQSEASDAAEKLSRLLKTAEVAYESQKTSYDNLVFESEELEKELFNRKQRFNEEMREAEEEMQPKRERYQADIAETKFSNAKAAQLIETIQKTLQENMQKINGLKAKNEEYDTEEKKLLELKLKIIDSPDHYAKSAFNLELEIEGMKKKLEEAEAEIQRKDKVCINNSAKCKAQQQQHEEIHKQLVEEIQNCRAIESEIESLKTKNYNLEEERGSLKISTMTIEKECEDQAKNLKSLEERVNMLNKQFERNKRQYKKEELQKKQFEDQILEYEMMIEKLKREQADVNSEMRDQKDSSESLSNDLVLIDDRINNLKRRLTSSDDQTKDIEREIMKSELELLELKKNVAMTQKQVKDLTAVRESMARKASSAMSEVRQTREQLKVKELLILDLTKKYQETENKLEHFKALYQEVKSARNKYVNLIQNSSQDLAQLKERIKILQTELEILKNESAEKNRSIQDYNHLLQLEKHKRDQMKAKFNKYEFERKEKQEQVDQNINQTMKLNMIILSLQKDIQKLRQNYTEVCENRNYTGIQLIDRNDELCILIEKSNVQANVLRKGQIAVKSLEDKIRMINIEISETERKIKVARDKILVVPELAQEVLKLQQELEIEKQKEAELSQELENPNNSQRWRELQGEDPDEEALDAKISVLEERLNSKKEQLLEKELILDEVTNLTDKLRTEAVEGRQSTLEISEKVNDFQARLKDITRKMKATISELTMCQALAIKYEENREKLSGELEEAKKRMEEGLPPTPETEIEYLKMMRDKKRYQEEREIRMRNELIEQSYPPFATKTTAQHRVNAYIPDEIGLPKPYGKNAPFKPSEKGANMRHFRNPKIKPIQI